MTIRSVIMDFDIKLISDRRELDMYIDDILALQENVGKAMQKESWYIQTTREEIYSLFDNDGIILLAMNDSMVAAVSIAGNYHADAVAVKSSGIRLDTSN